MTIEAHEKSKAVWGQMAPGWDRYRDFMWGTTKHVAAWLVDRVDPQAGDTILDLAGGVGDNGFLAAQRVGDSGKVVVTDFAPEMVVVAERRAQELGLGNVEARVLDAENMDLGDDSIDGIVCRWGFMLMIDPATALRECRRVLKDGKNLAFSVWGPPEENPWITVTGMTMMQLGHPMSMDPFGPGGMFSMASEDKIREMVTAAGFDEVTVEPVQVEWSFPSFEEAWEFMTHVAGPIASAVKEFPEDEIDKLRSTLEANEQQFMTDSGLVQPGLTYNVGVR